MPIHPVHAKRLPEEVHRALLDDAELLRPEGVARAMLHTVPTSSVRATVGRNTVPTLRVAGGKEREFEEPRVFAEEHMPDLDIVVLEAGHAVNIQAADGFNSAVTNFFESR